MDSVIASRRLESSNGNVDIMIGAPSADGDDWFTPWTIVGLADQPVSEVAGGVDSMQSLIVALAMVGDRLHSAGVSLSFLGSDSLGLLTTMHPDDQAATEWVAQVSSPIVGPDSAALLDE